MYWKSGTSRKVLVIPALGICLKFARISPWQALKGTWRHIRKAGWSSRGAVRYWKYPIKDGYGGRVLVLRGIRDNWREWRYSVRRPHPVLARTYLSFGVVNVQEAVEPCALPFDACPRQVDAIAGWRFVQRLGDLHSFTSKNFGVRAGKACVVDYASPAMQAVLDGYADRIYAELNATSPPS